MSDFYKSIKKEGYYKDKTYYIHLHSQNIGRVTKNKNGKGERQEISNMYNTQKKKAFNLAKQEYKKNVEHRISSNGVEGLNQLFNKDSDYTRFDKELQKNLQENLNVDNLAKLMELHKNLNSFSFLENNTKMYIEQYNRMINIFSQMAELIQGREGELLAAALRMAKYKGHKKGESESLSALGSRLRNAVEKVQLEGKEFYPQEIAAAVQQIEYLTNSLKREKTAGGKDITDNVIKNICKNIVSAGFAESLAMNIKSAAKFNVNNVIKKAVGTKGTFVPQEDGTSKWVSQGKEDVHLENIEITIGEKNKTTYIIDIGISSKFYKGNLMFGQSFSSRKTKNIISSGAGDTLGNLIKRTFLRNYDRYIVYNAFATLEEASTIQQIQEIILMRNINIFFAGSSQADFNTFIFANGQVISIWQLIQSAFENNIGTSRSIMTDEQPIALSIQKRKEIREANKKIDDDSKSIIALAWERSKNVNNIINNDAKVTAHINTLKFLNR